jgi:predicted DNA-binding transcriptional regulator YafY
MRAARVLDMLLVLQRSGQLTAGELARQLEVSERTVLRDVEALSEAGIPIYTSRGAGGGIALMDGFRTHLTGLSDDEASCLLLAGQPQLARRLGLAAGARGARQKLLAAISPPLADQAQRLDRWFLHDPEPDGGPTPPDADLLRLVRGVRQHRQVELTPVSGTPITVQPLGLVLHAGSWLVVVGCAGAVRLGRLDRVRSSRLTGQRFEPPAGFDLARFWADRREPAATAAGQLTEAW